MSGSTRELLKAVAVLSDNANLRACVKQSGRGAIVCGAMCMLGGLLMGPPGLAIGGTLGGLTAYATSDPFRPVGAILLNDLSPQQEKELVEHINAAVANFHVSDLVMLISLLSRNTDIQTAVLHTVTSFVTNELKMQIID